jgi:hypothetical protein
MHAVCVHRLHYLHGRAPVVEHNDDHSSAETFFRLEVLMLQAGLPDGMISNQKSQLG